MKQPATARGAAMGLFDGGVGDAAASAASVRDVDGRLMVGATRRKKAVVVVMTAAKVMYVCVCVCMYVCIYD